MFGVGFLLRYLGVRELFRSGMSRSQILLVRKPERYVTTGIYRWLKHPLYIGSLLMIGGVGCFLLGFKGIALILPALPFFFDRIEQENYLREGDPDAQIP
jgi:protein-S-isoprenylcysteine O-methyltransferase Ste14